MRYTAYFRHPKTSNEMRQYVATSVNELEIPINVRGRRSAKCLPNAWDDIFRSDTRNWKAYRKTQWKIIKKV
jgi:hypothetical protein